MSSQTRYYSHIDARDSQGRLQAHHICIVFKVESFRLSSNMNLIKSHQNSTSRCKLVCMAFASAILSVSIAVLLLFLYHRFQSASFTAYFSSICSFFMIYYPTYSFLNFAHTDELDKRRSNMILYWSTVFVIFLAVGIEFVTNEFFDIGK